MSTLLGKITGTILGILAFIAIFIICFGLLGIVVYGFGWSVGWIIHLFVGPDALYGIFFEQLIGLIWILGAVIYISVTNATRNTNNKLVEQFKNITKKYRGY